MSVRGCDPDGMEDIGRGAPVPHYPSLVDVTFYYDPESTEYQKLNRYSSLFAPIPGSNYCSVGNLLCQQHELAMFALTPPAHTLPRLLESKREKVKLRQPLVMALYSRLSEEVQGRIHAACTGGGAVSFFPVLPRKRRVSRSTRRRATRKHRRNITRR